MEIKEEEFVYQLEALKVLEDRDMEDLAHEQRVALENLTRHTKIRDMDTLKELNKELSEIDALKEQHIYKLLELVPQRESTVRAVFQKERIKLEDSDVQKILEICQSVDYEEYVPETPEPEEEESEAEEETEAEEEAEEESEEDEEE